MDKRAKRMERLYAVQRQLHRVEEWKLAEIERRLVRIAENCDQLMTALDQDEALQSLFFEAGTRRLAALAREADEATREQNAQRDLLVEQALRLKTVEKLYRTLSEVERGAEERAALLDLIETLLEHRAQASHKFGRA
jgi:hypothetical protein